MRNTDVFEPEEMARLDQLDAGLRQEADEFLRDSGLGRAISDAGFAAVGSYVTRTMVWRDLDFERMDDSPSWQDHWALGQAFEETGWVWRLTCVDAYRDEYSPGDLGFYWGLRATRPDGGPIWKLDLWTARPQEFALEQRKTWAALMTPEARLHILAIKEFACSRPEYRRSLLSVHIYEAVLERGITGVETFFEWWRNTHGG